MAVVLANKQWQDYVYEGRSYFVYTPTNYHVGAAVPLVMLLHGSPQSPSDLAYDTQMNQLADQQQFLVVYPQLYPQHVDLKPGNPNPMLGLNIFYEVNQLRGSGAAGSLAGIVQAMVQNTSRWTIDRRRIYVAGISVGAVMVVILGATYPDLFAAIGVHSGSEYQWARLPSPPLLSQASAAGVEGQEAVVVEPSSDASLLFHEGLLRQEEPVRQLFRQLSGSGFGPGPDPIEQGQKAYEAMGSFARMVPTIVFHGTADPIVASINGEQVVRQWLHTNHLASHGTFTANFESPSSIRPGQVPGGRSYTVFTWKDATGNDVVAYWLVDGMGHAWSGGSPDRTFTDPQGPSATRAMYEFFMAHARV